LNDTKPTFSFGVEETAWARSQEIRDKSETMGKNLDETIKNIELTIDELRAKVAVFHRLTTLLTEAWDK